MGAPERCSYRGMSSGEEDATIIDAARQGDRAAWEQLYSRIYPRLRSFLVRKTGAAEAEDAINETMARAIAGIKSYTPGDAGFDGWVFGIARHVAADHHRRVARDRRQRSVAHRVDGSGRDQWFSVDDNLELEDDHARLRSMFERLDPEQKELLELRVIARLTADEVAAVLQRRPGAVRTAQSRALARLRQMMETDHVGA